MTSWQWNGARWWKFDFHTHTPASEDYGKGPDQAQLQGQTSKDWLRGYMEAQIDCVAITDHNTGAWIDELETTLAGLEKERPEWFRPLHLFPGVEISVQGGIHVLAILSLGKKTSDVDMLLGAIGFDGTQGKTDGVTRSSFVDVVRAIKDTGGLAIPAHVDQVKGLFVEFEGDSLKQALDSSVIALEVVDTSGRKPQLYLDSKRTFAEVLGSDAHHPHGKAGPQFPGSHFTWIKMARPNIEGLRLALLDGPLSVHRSDQTTDEPNATHAALTIESIEISKARYMGRSKPFGISFNPWLNTIIGGRGAGKSTLVEFSRIALRREGELPPALHDDLTKYRMVCESRGEEGLLTSESRFVVTYRKNKTRYRIQWNVDGTLEPIEVEDDAGGWRVEVGDVAQRFPVRICSQKQIFELAKDPLALLKIVDEAPEVDGHSMQERWQVEHTRFLALRGKAREIESGLADEPRLQGELEDTKRKLAVFEEAGHANVLKAYQRRIRQSRAVESWEKSWFALGDRLRELAADLVPDPPDLSTSDEKDAAAGDLQQRAEEPLDELKRVCGKLEALAQELDSLSAEWASKRDETPWKQAVDDAISRYQDLGRRLTKEGAGDPTKYGQLVQHRQALETRLDSFDAQRKQVKSVRADADAALARLLELRREQTRRRKKFLEKVLDKNEHVQIRIVPYGARNTVESELRNLTQKEDGRFEKDIENLLNRLYVDEPDVGTLEERFRNLKRIIRTIAEGSHNPEQIVDQRFANHLAKLPPEALDRVDAWFPEDTLSVHYSTAEKGARFRPIYEGSPGQKTAALLAFLLSYGYEPIILDQPEDDLDNHLIYELIVTQLRNIKQHRQVIVVTHNANIVVNGDAELVVALVPRNGETGRECEGSLQEQQVRDTICEVMEGGRKAFEERYRRIALGGASHV